MQQRVLAVTAFAAVFAFGVLSSVAQAQGPVLPDSAPQNKDIGGLMGRGGAVEGMMGGGMMGDEHGMMGHGIMRGGIIGQRPPRGMAPLMMRMMFSLMDADGDGKLSLQEFQAAHERIFKAIDANKDGFVTFEEMQSFIRGTSSQQ